MSRAGDFFEPVSSASALLRRASAKASAAAEKAPRSASAEQQTALVDALLDRIRREP